MELPGPTQDPGTRFFHNAQGVNIGTFSVNSAGRDIVHVTNHYYGWGVPPDAASIRDNLRKKIRAWLRGPIFLDIYRASIAQRAEQTGMWFIQSDEFQRFLKERGTTLWVTGMPGSGKTILSSTCIKHLQDTYKGDKYTAVICAYVRYSEHYTLQDIVTGLVNQLVRVHDGALEHIEPYYRTSMEEETPYEVSELFEVLKKIARPPTKVFVVIDGLDEAGEEVKDGLLETLPHTGVNLLIFSRPLDKYTHRTPNALFVSIQARTEDIALCVVEYVKRSSRLQAIVGGKPDLIQRLCDAIKDKANGMFLVAKLQLESLKRNCNSVASLFKEIESLPSGIDEMYQLTMDRINAQPRRDVSIAHRLFTWIMHHLASGDGNFSVEDASYALAVSYDSQTFDKDDTVDISLILSACGGLVTISPGAHRSWSSAIVSTFRFIHYTTMEFMQTIQFSTIPTNPHNYLAVTCVVFLEHLDIPYFNIPERSQPDELSTGLSRWERRTSSPFLGYAADQWMDHAVLAQGPLHPYLHTFFERYPTLGEGGDSLPSLHFAAKYGLTEVISTGHLPNPIIDVFHIPDDIFRTPFHFAARYCQFEAFRALISAYPGVHIPTGRGNSFLHIVIQNSGLEEYRQFVEEFFSLVDSLSPEDLSRLLPTFDVNAQNTAGQTPLMMACSRTDCEVLRILISRPDIRPNIRDPEGRSAFYLACASETPPSFTDIQETVVSSFALFEPDIQSNSDGTTAFMMACSTQKLPLVRKMLDSSSSDRRFKFLHETDGQGHTAFLTCLVFFGVELYIREGIGPVNYPRGHPPGAGFVDVSKEVLDVLIQADPTVLYHRDKRAQTGLMLLANNIDRCSRTVIPFLLSQPTLDPNYINFQDEAGRTALMHAVLCEGVEYNAPATMLTGPHRDDVRSRWRFLQMLLSHPTLNLQLRDRWGRDVVEIAYSEPWLDHWRRYPQDLAIDDPALDGHPIHVLPRLHILLDTNRLCPPHVIRKAVIGSSGKPHQPVVWRCSTDYVVCRRLIESWVTDSFTWTIQDTDTITLLAQTAKRACRLPVALVLSHLGLLEQPFFPRGWMAESGDPLVLELDDLQPERFCANGCDWHTKVVPLKFYYDRHDKYIPPIVPFTS